MDQIAMQLAAASDDDELLYDICRLYGETNTDESSDDDSEKDESQCGESTCYSSADDLSGKEDGCSESLGVPQSKESRISKFSKSVMGFGMKVLGLGQPGPKQLTPLLMPKNKIAEKTALLRMLPRSDPLGQLEKFILGNYDCQDSVLETVNKVTRVGLRTRTVTYWQWDAPVESFGVVQTPAGVPEKSGNFGFMKEGGSLFVGFTQATKKTWELNSAFVGFRFLASPGTNQLTFLYDDAVSALGACRLEKKICRIQFTKTEHLKCFIDGFNLALKIFVKDQVYSQFTTFGVNLKFVKNCSRTNSAIPECIQAAKQTILENAKDPYIFKETVDVSELVMAANSGQEVEFTSAVQASSFMVEFLKCIPGSLMTGKGVGHAIEFPEDPTARLGSITLLLGDLGSCNREFLVFLCEFLNEIVLKKYEGIIVNENVENKVSDIAKFLATPVFSNVPLAADVEAKAAATLNFLIFEKKFLPSIIHALPPKE